jgi:hypothetical protein
MDKVNPMEGFIPHLLVLLSSILLVIFLLVNRGWILRVDFGWVDLVEQPSHGLFIPTHLLGACMKYFLCDKILQ